MLAAKVAAGELPPVQERLPDLPPVEQAFEAVGKYGGTLRHVEALYTNFGSITRYMNEGLIAVSVPSGTHRYPNLAESIECQRRSDDLHHPSPEGREVVGRRGIHRRGRDVQVGGHQALLPRPRRDPAVGGARRLHHRRRAGRAHDGRRLHDRRQVRRAVRQLPQEHRLELSRSGARPLPETVPSQVQRGAGRPHRGVAGLQHRAPRRHQSPSAPPSGRGFRRR